MSLQCRFKASYLEVGCLWDARLHPISWSWSSRKADVMNAYLEKDKAGCNCLVEEYKDVDHLPSAIKLMEHRNTTQCHEIVEQQLS